MGLSPNEARVEQLDTLEPLDVLEAKCEQFCAFQLAEGPRGTLVAIAVTTMVKHERFRYSLRDVDLTLKAVDAGIGRVGLCHDTANATAGSGCQEHVRVDGLSCDFRARRTRVGLVTLSILHVFDRGALISNWLLVNCRLEKHVLLVLLIYVHFFSLPCVCVYCFVIK